MLRMNQRRSANDARLYYTRMIKHQEYLSEHQGSAGRWHGSMIESLGLEGTVTEQDFGDLADNIDPMTKERMTLRNRANRTAGYDFNFHPPKSVSIMHAFTKDERILTGFRKAVRETMEEIEQGAQTRVRVFGQDHDRPTRNLAWAEFIHFTSRPVNGMPDPHLHAHCFVFNVTYDPEEKRWKAAQFRGIHRDAPYYEEAFHARLASELEAIGYRIREARKAFEIEGVPESLIKKFSRRTRQIEDLAQEKGITDAVEKSKLGAVTREKKAFEISDQDLQIAWRAIATPEELIALNRARPWPELPPDHPWRVRHPELEQQALEYAKEACFERHSVVDESRFVGAALKYAKGKIDPRFLRERMAADPTLIQREQEGRKKITTTEVLAEEMAVVDWVKRGKGTQQPLAANHPAGRAGGAGSHPNEQKRAIHQILESKDRITAVVGKAGAGKTTLMKEVVAAIESRGHRLIAVAPSAETGRGTLPEEGFKNTNTVEQLLSNRAMSEMAQGAVWWIDEAGLISMPDMLRLTRHADALHARMILTGDTAQHRSVRRGDAFRTMIEHGGLEVATLWDIKRQSGLYKEVVEQLAQGRVEEAFEGLDAMGAIKEMDWTEGHQFIAEEYLRIVSKKESVLVVSPTHAEGRAVTKEIRSRLREEGLLGEERKFNILRRIDMLEADQKIAENYSPGQVVEMVRAAKGHQVGSRFTISDVSDGHVYVIHPDGIEREFDVRRWVKRFQVYEPDTLSIAVGDKIRVTKNGLSVDRRHEVHNGTVHVVKGFTLEGHLKLDKGAAISKDFLHLAHGYVTTSHAAQSKTVQHILIAENESSFLAASLAQFYVSVSRGRSSVVVVTSDKMGMFEAVREDVQRSSAVGMDVNKTVEARTRSVQDHQCVTNGHFPTEDSKELDLVPDFG